MRKVKTILLVLTLAFVVTASFVGRSTEVQTKTFIESPLEIAMDTVHYNYFINKGLPSGFQLDLLKEFASNTSVKYNIHLIDDSLKLDMLKNGEIDVIVFSEGLDSLYTLLCDNSDIVSTIPFDDTNKTVWLVKNTHKNIMSSVNVWLSTFKGTRQYGNLQVKYFNKDYGKCHSKLSNYDHLFKKYAEQYDWDWRLIASLAYQESNFKPNVRSNKGAAGLMQLMPVVASQFGVRNVYSPEESIKGGVKMLNYLRDQVVKDSIPEDEQLKFILAAYNAGYGRITNCRKYTDNFGSNPDSWNDVHQAIETMRFPTKEQSKYILRGKFNGEETLNFVKQIERRYKHYKHFYN